MGDNGKVYRTPGVYIKITGFAVKATVCKTDQHTKIFVIAESPGWPGLKFRIKYSGNKHHACSSSGKKIQ
jgi:hypothetical protein